MVLANYTNVSPVVNYTTYVPGTTGVGTQATSIVGVGDILFTSQFILKLNLRDLDNVAF